MKKEKSEKILIIVSLLVAIITLGVGFAAFSNTLTISSSATVSPDESDFKLVLYGLPNKYYMRDGVDRNAAIFDDVNSYTSTVKAGPLVNGEDNDAEFAIIDNDNLTLKNIKANLKKDVEAAYYYLVLKNEGKYDAYLDLSNFEEPAHTCVPDVGTTKELVDKTCERMDFGFNFGFYDESTGKIDWTMFSYIDENKNVKIPVNSYMYIYVAVGYLKSSTFADGDFTVTWDDLKLNFSTVSKSSN